MPLPTVTQAQVEAALHALGIQPGDGLMTHSALQLLGQPEGGPELYLRAVLNAIGPAGTLVAPTYAFIFHKGIDYDPASAPSKDMGVFAELVRQHPESRRTRHPMQPLSVIGPLTEELTALDTHSAYEPGSPADHLLAHDFKLLLLGADIQAVSMVHYSEQRASVPYRYWKDFTGRIRLGGEWHTRTYGMFVRDEKYDAQLVLKPIQTELERRGQWQAVRLNFGWLSTCRLRDFVAVTDELLAADPWALVSNRPSSI